MKLAGRPLAWLVAAAALFTPVGFGQEEPPAVPEFGVARAAGPPAGPPVAGTELEQRTDELSSRMRCPVCQALSVADSPSAAALAMKDEVRGLLAAGYSEEQVIESFERAYGEFIRLEPKPQGFNLLVWVAPGIGLLIGLVLVVFRLRASPGSDRTPDRLKPQELDEDDLEEYLRRVRREVGA